jgi:hypothetical protein
MTKESDRTVIEEQALKQVSGDAETVSGGSQTMLCTYGSMTTIPTAFVHGHERGGSNLNTDQETFLNVSNDASVDEIIVAINR